jgi:hypothetical protein
MVVGAGDAEEQPSGGCTSRLSSGLDTTNKLADRGQLLLGQVLG